MKNRTTLSLLKKVFYLLPAVLILGSQANAQRPVITSFSPLTAAPGSSVTISGSNFNVTTANNIVYFGAAKAIVTGASATSLTVTVPAGATYAPLSILNTSTELSSYSTLHFTPSFSPAMPPPMRTVDFTLSSTISASIPTRLLGMTAGDLDNDGKPDLVLTNGNLGNNKVYIRKNTGSNGTISFGSVIAIDIPGADRIEGFITIGDVDGDGRPDILATGGNSNNFSVLRNTGTLSGFVPSTFATGAGPVGAFLGDFDSDGKMDVVTTDYNVPQISVFRNTGSPGVVSFDTPVSFTTGGSANHLAVGDFNADGKPDIIVNRGTSNLVRVFENTTTGSTITFSVQDITVLDHPSSVVPADIDNDGKLDVVVTSAETSETRFSILRNTSAGTISFTHTTAQAGSHQGHASVADLNGDGKADLLLATSQNYATSPASDYRIAVVTNTSSPGTVSFDTKMDLAAARFPVSVAAADFSGDGKPDLLSANHSVATISIYRNTLQYPPVISSFSPSAAAAGSTLTITGTGFNPVAANNIVFFGAVKASVTVASETSLTVTVPTGATHAPLSVLNTYNGLIAYSNTMFLPGSTVAKPGILSSDFTSEGNIDAGGIVLGLSVADLDDDGKPDLIANNLNSGSLHIHKNTSTAGAVTFDAPLTNMVGGRGVSARHVGIGDIDGDGKPDIAVANQSGNSLTILRNIGALNFDISAAFPSGAAPNSAAVSDLDGDGKADVVTANYNGSSISVFRNAGTGPGVINFSSKVDFAVGANAQYLYIADIDGDTKPDILVGCPTAKLSVFRNTSTRGSVSFAARQDYALGITNGNVSAADLDGDGKPEVVVANGAASSVYIFSNTSSPGTVQLTRVSPDVAAARINISAVPGDLNGDNKADMLLSYYSTFPSGSTYRVALLPNSSTAGSVSFDQPVDFAADNIPFAAVIADLNGDGKPDFISANSATNSLSVYRNTMQLPPAITSFSPVRAAPGASVTITGTGFNATAANNIVHFGPVRASVTAAGSTSLTVTVPAGAAYESISVLNADNKMQALSLQKFIPSFTPSKSVLVASDMAELPSMPALQGAYDVRAGDFDGNGKPDLVVTYDGTASVSVFPNTGSSGTISFVARTDLPAGNRSRYSAVGDVDGDGKLDIAVASFQDNTISVYRNNGSGSISFEPKIDFAAGNGTVGLALADIDEDGRPDLVAGNFTSNTVSVFRNTSTGTTISFAPRADFATGNSPAGLWVADIDGDGKLDILVAASNITTGNVISVLRNTGNGTVSFAPRLDLVTPQQPQNVLAGDIDGDGKADIAVQGFADKAVSVYRNTGSAGILAFAPRVDMTLADNPWSLALNDMNGDGKPDLLALSPMGSVSMLANASAAGSASFLAPVDLTVSNSPAPRSFLVTDLDGDAKPDMAVVNGNIDIVSLFHNQLAYAPTANVVYVNKNVSGGTGDGSSWTNAVRELADVLKWAQLNRADWTAANPLQIWVAGGTYKPLYSPVDNNFGNAAGRSNAFLLVNDVKLYGGFAGTETALAQRDLSLTANASILSGDFNGNDAVSGSGSTLSITNNNENAYQVVLSMGDAGTGLIDGFTITGGNADGGSMGQVNGQVALVNSWGGGMYIAHSPNLQILRVRLSGNKAATGGGMAIFGSSVSPKLEELIFSNNLATSSGGALYSSQNASLLNSSFLGNKSDGIAGAILKAAGTFVVDRCLFAGNAGTGSGGAIYDQTGVGNRYMNTVFTANSSGGKGGAVFVGNIFNTRTNSFANCSFSNNTAVQGSATIEWTSSSVSHQHYMEFVNSIISDGDNSVGAGDQVRAYLKNTLLRQNGTPSANILLQGNSSTLLNLAPGFTDADGADNILGTPDDDLRLAAGSAAKNAGDNNLYEAADGNAGNNSLGLDRDLAGSSRLQGTIIDLGAYESSLLTQSITAGNLSKVYGSTDFEPGATATSGLTVAYASADPAIAEAYQDALDGNKWKLKIKQAGTVTITASQGGSPGYEPAPDATFTLTVTPRPVTALITASTLSKVYDGTPSGTLTAADVGLAAGSIVGTDQVQLALSSAGFSFDTKEAGTAKTITLPLSGLSLSGAQAANYTLANTLDLTAAIGAISPRPLTVTANNFSKVYNGTAYSGGNGVSYTGFALGEDASLLSGSLAFGGSSQGATGVGTYPIVPSGLSSPNYAISYAAGQLTISLNNVNTLSFTAQTPGATVSRTYGDADINAAAVASSGLAASYQSSNTAVASVSASGQVSLVGTGTATITVSQAGDTNYGPASPISFTVQVGRKALTVTANDFSRTYNGLPYSGGNGVSYSGFVDNEGPAVLSGSLSYGGSSQGAVNTGIYTLVPSGLTAANYSLDYRSGTLSIVQAGSNVLTFNSQVAGSTVLRTYGEGGGSAAATASSGLAASYQSSNMAVASVDASGTVLILSAGTTTITASQAGNINYPAAAPVSFTLTVQKKALTVTANNAVREYNGQANTTGNGVSYTGFIAGEDEQNLQGTLTYSGTAIGAKDVGSYFISPGGYSSANYAISYQDGSLTITKASVAVRATAQSKTYGDTDPALSYTSTGLIGSDAFGGSLQRAAGEDAGSYLIGPGTLSAGANYTLLYTPAELTIDKAPLTIAARASATCQGSALPAFTVTYSGFKRGDSESSLTARPVVSTTATAASPAGTYTLTPAGAVSGNYTFTYINSALTVNALPVVTISSDKGNSVSKGETVVLSAPAGAAAYSWSGPGILSGQNGASISVRHPAGAVYTVTLTNAAGCSLSASFTLSVREDFQAIGAKNVITPNGDGFNDTWVIDNIDFYPNNTVTVFDRNSKVVYTKRGYDNSWDGTYNGSPLPQGTYYFIIDYGVTKGTHKGFITLVR